MGLSAGSRMIEVTPSLSERSIRPIVIVKNQQKAAFCEKKDSKQHKNLSIKIHHNRMVSYEKVYFMSIAKE